jgi:type 1 fimbriae regulatory protein FimB/type 1 fimbriae regulatory protein FimE
VQLDIFPCPRHVRFTPKADIACVIRSLPFPVHAHTLRHACGYALANKGIDTRTLQAYLGHRSIQSTVRYTELAPGRFKNLWR